jgi:hypothetical protein
MPVVDPVSVGAAQAMPQALPKPPAQHDEPFATRLAHRAASLTASRRAAGPLRRESRAGEGPGVAQEVTDLLAKIRGDERRLDRYVRRALRGADFELPELVAMQQLAYRYTQRVELLSKLVDRLTGAVRQTLQTQL